MLEHSQLGLCAWPTSTRLNFSFHNEDSGDLDRRADDESGEPMIGQKIGITLTVVTISSVEEADGIHFLTMEVDGAGSG